MKPAIYRRAAERILRNTYDPSRLQRADRLLAVAARRSVRRAWRTLDEVKAESQARGAAVFVAWDGSQNIEWHTDRDGHGGAIVGTPEQINAFLATHPHVRPGLRVAIDCAGS